MGLLDFTPLGEYARNVDRGLITVLVMLMSEPSQAERTAMETAYKHRVQNMVAATDFGDFKGGWLAGRDYGRERERGREAALDVANKEIAYLCERESQAEGRERILEDVLTVIAGDYGCGLIEPPDQSLPPEGDPCHERYPDDPEKWCVSCIASMALLGLKSSHPGVLSERSNADEAWRRVGEDIGEAKSDTEPGEPEGQCTWCDNKRVLMEPDGSKLQRCPHCQPDHGPGEPSEQQTRSPRKTIAAQPLGEFTVTADPFLVHLAVRSISPPMAPYGQTMTPMQARELASTLAWAAAITESCEVGESNG